ncbi:MULTISPECIES: D-alanine:D-lactate ligase-like protein [unclassified Mesorhizobium]|uniref:D-alanine:D-lactate ligase-like protein n=1 Tax=unclassified Mesorhizobium TaxID=325217 RepID=UPI000FCCBF96|nr:MULTISPECIES: D-alanine:D-lactate ligase-like protein [unclassified Mesorhizobium]TGP24387.1 D-alanine:D-lactate ligase-like protein [Mesorhizobium sp. M1D.F.Ca.ET.231.01.1.1]TGP35025.1 D-alanine:D-lactate ligase-like protein [Mesorhizobium sp. M1D.F.Ca.ET.234.01.1.1]TGS49048.1 D-alanine:D-lactate ligase-like protein [Mesorhizobium sp. M1D.F.Ca.ET.184.01.1.1]TGS63248.1 D-alanine:D-lactate ligase-like protein [Mesorhizobium sp. M1D.F.Ca.ET.183.01.1.1]
MPRNRPMLILVHEPEKACFDRLVADGYPTERAIEISSYLAQSTDLAPEFGQLAAACEKRGLAFMAVELSGAAAALAEADPAKTLVWTLTDGIAYFRGGASPALARLNGLKMIGADDSLFALCQDKFRSGAVLGALGLPAPAAGLACNGAWLVEPPASAAGWFVKPNRLGAKIGIWPDSRVTDLGHALELSRRVFGHYRDEVVVQPYVAGRNARASFLGLKPQTGVEALGIAFVESGGDFQTMADSMALYGDTGQAARNAGTYAEPELEPVAASQPAADRAIRAIAQRLMNGLGLGDVFSVDFRVEADDTIHLIEFEVCPGLPCFDFRDYCRRQWGLCLADAMAETAANRNRLTS